MELLRWSIGIWTTSSVSFVNVLHYERHQILLLNCCAITCDGKKHYFIYFYCRFGNTEETSSQYINFKQPLFLINLHTAVLVSVFLSLHFVCAFSKLISLVNGLLVTFHFYLCCCVSSLIIARRYRTFYIIFTILPDPREPKECSFKCNIVHTNFFFYSLDSLWKVWMFIVHAFQNSPFFSGASFHISARLLEEPVV